MPNERPASFASLQRRLVAKLGATLRVNAPMPCSPTPVESGAGTTSDRAAAAALGTLRSSGRRDQVIIPETGPQKKKTALRIRGCPWSLRSLNCKRCRRPRCWGRS